MAVSPANIRDFLAGRLGPAAVRPPVAPVTPPVAPVSKTAASPAPSHPVTSVATALVRQGVNPTLAMASAAKAYLTHAGFNPTGVTHPAGTVANVPGIKPPTTSSGGGVTGPYVPPGGTNPYTGKPLGPNEYVGVAGSEADHPGMVRIPPPGWDNPSSPFYERRDYWIAPDGSIVANEPGFQASPDHPYNTGRPGEVNSEFANRPGYQHVAMSQPGVTPWGPGGQEATPNPWQAPASLANLPPWLQRWFQYLQSQH